MGSASAIASMSGSDMLGPPARGGSDCWSDLGVGLRGIQSGRGAAVVREILNADDEHVPARRGVRTIHGCHGFRRRGSGIDRTSATSGTSVDCFIRVAGPIVSDCYSTRFTFARPLLASTMLEPLPEPPKATSGRGSHAGGSLSFDSTPGVRCSCRPQLLGQSGILALVGRIRLRCPECSGPRVRPAASYLAGRRRIADLLPSSGVPRESRVHDSLVS